MKYTQIPVDTFKNIQLNAGILVKTFTPASGTIGDLLGATTGGLTFNDAPSFSDFGEDIDNCPKNTMELKKLDSREVTMAGTFVTVNVATAKMLSAAADVDTEDATHIIPRNELLSSDFTDMWWIGDYSDVNTGENAGHCAIHLLNVLNTSGFQIKSTDNGKGQFAFNYMGHYSMANQDQVPYEVFIKQGNEVATPSILLNSHSATVANGTTVTLTANTVPADATVTWSSADSNIASVSDGVVTGEAEGNTIITASITQDGVTYNDTCTVIVTEAEGEG